MHHHTLLRRRLNLIDGDSSPCLEMEKENDSQGRLARRTKTYFFSCTHTKTKHDVDFFHTIAEWRSKAILGPKCLSSLPNSTTWFMLKHRFLFLKAFSIYVCMYVSTVECNRLGSYCTIRSYGRWSWEDGRTRNFISDGQKKEACDTALRLVVSGLFLLAPRTARFEFMSVRLITSPIKPYRGKAMRIPFVPNLCWDEWEGTKYRCTV